MGTGYPYVTYPTRREPSKPVDKLKEEQLARDYQNLRLDIASVEEMIASGGDAFDEDDLKRMDKAVVLMKVGAKMLKKVLRQRGYRELKPAVLKVRADG